MENPLLTAGDVVEVTGIPAREFQTWCYTKAVVPVVGGEGTGNFRQFTEMQALGVAVAYKLRSTERGCAMSYVAQVVAAFGAMDESQLLKAFARGKTHLCRIHQGKPLLDGSASDWIDVEQTHLDLKARIQSIEQRFAGFVGGRPRGLARAARAS